MPAQDERLPLDGLPARVTANSDFIGLFGNERIMPTQVRVLEQGDCLLFIRNMSWKQEIKPKQQRIFKLMTRYGGEDAPGDITVVCLWGLPGTHREMQEFTGGAAMPRQAVTTEEVQAYLRDWFIRRKRSR